MDHSSRRRRFGLIAIAIAALATAATSPSPTAAPELSSSEKGTFSLTADMPIAWLDVTARENDALLAAGGQTVIRIQGQSSDLGVLFIAGDPADKAPTSNIGAALKQVICASGAACAATVRLTAILLDPAANPEVEVVWTATAETRFPPKGGPVPAAALAVDVGRLETRPADALGLALTKPETIELGPDLPRTVRAIHLTLPSGPVPGSVVGPAVLLLTTDHGAGTVYRPPATITVTQADKVLGSDWSFGHMFPFAECDAGAPCEVDLVVALDWTGGPAAGSTFDWSLVAWPGVTTGESMAMAGIVVSPPTDVAWGKARLTASETGQTTVTSKSNGRVFVTAELDLQGAPKARYTDGLVRLTFRAALAAGSDQHAEIGVHLGETVDSAVLRPGEPVIVYSRAAVLGCDRLSTCSASFVVEIARSPKNVQEATIDWTADVEFVPHADYAVLDGANLWIDAGPPRQ